MIRVPVDVRHRGTEEAPVKWIDEAAEASASPGVWFEISERRTEEAAWSFAAHIRSGRKRAFAPAGTFDATAHGRRVFVMRVVEA